MFKFRFPLDGYSAALLLTVALAGFVPVRGAAASALSLVTTIAIGLLFFLHGARLSRRTVIEGATHWRLHLLILACTFVLFPALGLAITLLPGSLLSAPMAAGFLFLALLPSTVQSSIAFTSMARGNVSAAICSAAISNLIGTMLTPALVAVFMGIAAHGGDTGAVLRAIALQLLAPFLAGQLFQPLLAGWIDARRKLVTMVDRGSILLVVYGAFSAAVVEGLFRKVSGVDLVTIAVLSSLLLAVVMVISLRLGRAFGFSREDRIAILFCGSKKSLASGVPMAGLMFPAASVGAVILPLMVFHQIQLLVCAHIARRYACDSEHVSA